MKILFTGGTSFTGYWLVRELCHAGHEVGVLLTRKPDEYEGLKQARLKRLPEACRLIACAPMGSAAFLQAASSHGWDVFCHHAADTRDYKSPGFDSLRALGNNTCNLEETLAALLDGGCSRVILTGTIFEADEGVGEEPLRAFSPYGLSKTLTWEVFRYRCAEKRMPLGKFVLPNPFGAYEEMRFTSYLISQWKKGFVPVVKTPDYVRDNIHVSLLAACYRKFVEQIPDGWERPARLNPSGYVETQREFAQRFGKEMATRLPWKTDLEFAPQTDFFEPLRRANTQPATLLVPEWDERASWDALALYYDTEF